MLTLDMSRIAQRDRLSALLNHCRALPVPRPFMRDGCMYGVQTIHAQLDLASRVVSLKSPDFHDLRRAEDGLRACYSLPL
jgi:hypothetical protein